MVADFRDTSGTSASSSLVAPASCLTRMTKYMVPVTEAQDHDGTQYTRGRVRHFVMSTISHLPTQIPNHGRLPQPSHVFRSQEIPHPLRDTVESCKPIFCLGQRQRIVVLDNRVPTIASSTHAQSCISDRGPFVGRTLP